MPFPTPRPQHPLPRPSTTRRHHPRKRRARGGAPTCSTSCLTGPGGITASTHPPTSKLVRGRVREQRRPSRWIQMQLQQEHQALTGEMHRAMSQVNSRVDDIEKILGENSSVMLGTAKGSAWTLTLDQAHKILVGMDASDEFRERREGTMATQDGKAADDGRPRRTGGPRSGHQQSCSSHLRASQGGEIPGKLCP